MKMKVLVYGAGIIGSYLTHVLCLAKNDVTLLARGKWKEQLEERGLIIRHHLQHKTTIDHPKIIADVVEEDSYDVVFAVMPYNKIGLIMEPLAKIHSPIVVLVGNNMSPKIMQDSILEKTVCEKQVLFGFQTTGGRKDKEKGILICERANGGAMDIGSIHGLPNKDTKEKLQACFARTHYRLNWQSDMEAYLTCHLASILPLSYLSYIFQGDLTKSRGSDRKITRMASREAYALLKKQGIPILPKNLDKYYMSGAQGLLMKFLYFVMAKNKKIGDLVAVEHCRNAYEEMEMLDKAFEEIISKTPDFPMPNWKVLKSRMPDWEKIRQRYEKKVDA